MCCTLPLRLQAQEGGAAGGPSVPTDLYFAYIMTLTPSLRPLALVLVAVLGLAACDASEQNLTWRPGDSLSIVGPYRVGSAAVIDDNAAAAGAPIYLPVYPGDLTNNIVHFYVRGFDRNKTYTWTLDGEPVQAIQDGEFGAVSVPATPGTYTVSVSNGEISGSRTFTVQNPNLNIQVGRFPAFSTLVTALEAADLRTALSAEGPFTLLAPRNAAFLALLDADGDGEVGGDELPDEEVLAEILSLHVIPGILRAADITDGATRTTLGGETVTFRRVGDQITVEGPSGTAAVVAPADVVVGNGVIHALDAVLLPADS